MTPVDQVLRFLGEVVLYGGGSAAVAFLLFQYLGKGWIDARFAERLEAFKEGQGGHGIRGPESGDRPRFSGLTFHSTRTGAR